MGINKGVKILPIGEGFMPFNSRIGGVVCQLIILSRNNSVHGICITSPV